eukprot:1329594-Rhodomonas_salina.3
MSGTVIAYAADCLPLRDVRVCCYEPGLAMLCTDPPYGVFGLRVCYAIPGTDILYLLCNPRTLLCHPGTNFPCRLCHPRTVLRYAATRSPVLPPPY